jgi:hypothetical protein
VEGQFLFLVRVLIRLSEVACTDPPWPFKERRRGLSMSSFGSSHHIWAEANHGSSPAGAAAVLLSDRTWV